MCQKKNLILLGFLSLSIIFVLSGWVQQVEAQQEYPTKPINLIVGYPPGGATDISARLVSIYLEKKWKIPINVINKPGGNAIPAVLDVIKATPDGYTLLADIITSYTMIHVALKDVPFKATDRDILAIWGATPNVWFVPPESQFKSLKDAEAEAKKDPENFTWTSLGGPSPQDFCMKQFFRTIGVAVSKTRPVMCKGGAQTIAMAAGGHVKLGFSAVATTIAPAKAGNVRVIGVTSPTRSRWPDFPDVPTTQELGYESITFGGWVGISGPLGMPPFVARIVNSTLQEMTKDPEMVSKIKQLGLEPYYLGSEQAREYVSKEIEEGRRVWSLK